jgi:hypothetical protein
VGGWDGELGVGRLVVLCRVNRSRWNFGKEHENTVVVLSWSDNIEAQPMRDWIVRVFGVICAGLPCNLFWTLLFNDEYCSGSGGLGNDWKSNEFDEKP